MLSPSSRMREPKEKGSVRFWLLAGSWEREAGWRAAGTPYASFSAGSAGCVGAVGGGGVVVVVVVVVSEGFWATGSTVTAKRMCSMALESCCLGCCLVETLLSVAKRTSAMSSWLEAMVQCGAVRSVGFVALRCVALRASAGRSVRINR